MSLYSQNLNQKFMKPALGSLTMLDPKNVFPVRIDPASTVPSFPSGTAVVYTTNTSNEILVDAASAATVPVVGVIVYNPKKSNSAAGDRRDLAGDGEVLNLLAAANITRGESVTYVPATWSGSTLLSDPAVTPTVSTNYQLGIALDNIAAGTAGRIQIKPLTTAHA